MIYMDLVENTRSYHFCVDLWLGKDIEKVYTNNSEMTVEKRMSNVFFHGFIH